MIWKKLQIKKAAMLSANVVAASSLLTIGRTVWGCHTAKIVPRPQSPSTTTATLANG